MLSTTTLASRSSLASWNLERVRTLHQCIRNQNASHIKRTNQNLIHNLFSVHSKPLFSCHVSQFTNHQLFVDIVVLNLSSYTSQFIVLPVVSTAQPLRGASLSGSDLFCSLYRCLSNASCMSPERIIVSLQIRLSLSTLVQILFVARGVVENN